MKKTFVLKYNDESISFDNPAQHFPDGIVGMHLDCTNWKLTKHGEAVSLPQNFKSYTSAIQFLNAAEPQKAKSKDAEPEAPKAKIKRF